MTARALLSPVAKDSHYSTRPLATPKGEGGGLASRSLAIATRYYAVEARLQVELTKGTS